VTLTGTGGVGKTRIAARLLDEYRETASGPDERAVFVSLAAWSNANLVLNAVAQRFALRKDEQPQSPTDFLRDELRDKPFFLVLDNCERLIEAGPTIASLIASCPGLIVLATSRRPLHIRSERVYPVDLLPVPKVDMVADLASLARTPSVALLVDRAQAHDYHFTLTTENAASVIGICVKLDGLPLALELVARRLHMLSPLEVFEQLSLSFLNNGLRDMPERQQTLTATIAWSYDLLNEREQGLFGLLSVFEGGCTHEAIEGVAGDSFLDGEIFTCLENLLDLSLVIATKQTEGATRYSMLEMIKEYAGDRLVAAKNVIETYRRHATYYARFENTTWLFADDFDSDYQSQDMANVGVALNRAIRSRWWQEAEKLAMLVCGYVFSVEGYEGDAKWQIESILFIPEISAHVKDKMRMILAALLISGRPTDDNYRRAKELYEESLAYFRGTGDDRTLLFATQNLIGLARDRGDEQEAISLIQERLTHFVSKGDIDRVLEDNLSLALILSQCGDEVEALVLFTRAMAILHGEEMKIRYTSGESNKTNDAIVFARILIESDLKDSDKYDLMTRLSPAFGSPGDSIDLALAIDVLLSTSFDPVGAYHLTAILVGLREKLEQAGVVDEVSIEDDTIEYLGKADYLEYDVYGEVSWENAKNYGYGLTASFALKSALELLFEHKNSFSIPITGIAPVTATKRTPIAGLEDPLTPREYEVVQLLIKNLSRREMADDLSMTYNTLSSHLGQIYAKFGVRSMTAARKFALEHGMTPSDQSPPKI